MAHAAWQDRGPVRRGRVEYRCDAFALSGRAEEEEGSSSKPASQQAGRQRQAGGDPGGRQAGRRGRPSMDTTPSRARAGRVRGVLTPRKHHRGIFLHSSPSALGVVIRCTRKCEAQSYSPSPTHQHPQEPRIGTAELGSQCSAIPPVRLLATGGPPPTGAPLIGGLVERA